MAKTGPRTSSHRARLLALPLVFVGAVLLLTACEAPRILTVTTFVDGSDANPGDGVCEMTVGAGDCSLRAAIDTANATAGSTPVTISVPSGTYVLTVAGADDTNAAGDLDFVAGSHGVVVEGQSPGVRIDANGAEAAVDVRAPLVDLKGVAVTGSTGPGVDVHSGQLRMYRGATFDNAGAGARIASGATLNMESVTLSGNGTSGASVAGTFNLSYSTITANTGGGITGSGTTNAGANIIANQTSGPDCSAAIVSNGGSNLDGDGTCGLAGTNDVTVADAKLAPLSATLVPFHRPNPGSPAIDSIGVAPTCGGPSGPNDATNAARPIGPACDRGALEANYTSVPTANPDSTTVDEDGPGTNVDVLGNDTDPDTGDSKTVNAIDTTGTVGSVTNNGGDVTYDPNGAFEALGVGENGSDTFGYTMTDASGNTASASVSVTVTGVNDTPTANADTDTVDASGPAITVNVLGNDTDPDTSDSLSVQSVDTTGTLGSVTNNGTNVTYDPNNQFPNDPNSLFATAAVGNTATDTFSYTAVDPSGATSTATVTITVTGLNHAPVATDDTATVDEDGPSVDIDVLGNDSDVDGPLGHSVGSVDTTGTLGSVTNNGSNVTYDPNGAFESLAAGATATDTFTYTNVDGNLASDTGLVTVTITGQNDGPTAVNDTGSVGEDGPPAMISVLDNDTDPDAFDSKDVQSVDNTGTVGQAQSFGTFVGYDPGSAFNDLPQGATATDTFSYTMVDGSGATSTATVTMTITGVNDAPMAVDDLGSVNEDGPGVTIDVLGNDTDPDTGDTKVVDDVNTSATLGSVTNNGTDVTYDPNGKFEGLQFGQSTTDTFSYRVADGGGGTDTATVTVTIFGANDAPVAVNDSATAPEDGPPVLISVLNNDTDADSTETKNVQSVDNTGTLGVATPFGASVGYDPNGAFNSLKAGATATDTFSYTMVDSQGATSTATVTVTITGQNDAPTAVDDTAATNEDATNVAIAVLGNDTDPDSGDTKSVQSVGALSNGGSITNNGTNVTFTPGASFQDLQVGSTRDTSFSYTMVDGSGATSNATVTITVSGVNDAPVAVNDGTYAGVVGNTKSVLGTTGTGPVVTLTGNVLSQNDTDPDAADTKTASLVSANSANVTVNANGSFEYTPAVGTQNTNVTFTYRVTDSQGANSNTATVTLNVVERVWYVNNNLGVNGDGRSATPFNNLASAAATDDAGDYVFLSASGTTYTGGIAMTSNEQLIGEPNGLTVAGAASTVLGATAGANPTITNATVGGHGITLANGANVQRVNVSGANTDGITGTSVTGATIGSSGNPITVSGSGGAELKLTGAAGGNIDAYANLANGSAGRAVEIQNRSSGTVNVNGSVSDTGGTGVLLNSNTGATINFGGAVTLSTGANAAFTATGGGTVTNSNSVVNTLSTTSGTAINVTSTSIGSAGLTFQSINAGTASGSAGNGITLDSTGTAGGNGGLTVTGTGSAGSGGTIQHKTGADGDTANGIGIFLRDTKNPSFTRMQLNHFDNMAIWLLSVRGFTFTNSIINGTSGTSSGSADAAIVFGKSNPSGLNGLVGGTTGTMTDVNISGAIEHNVEVYNQSDSFTLNITRANIHDNSVALGSDGILAEMQGTANATIVVDDSDFSNNKSQAMQAAANDNSNLNLTIKNSRAVRGTQGNEAFVLSNGSDGDLNATVQNNMITGWGGVSVFVGQTPGNATVNSNLDAKILNNAITTTTGSTNHAVLALLTSTVGQVAPARLRIDGNTITQNSTTGVARGILVDTPDTNTTPSYSAIVTNNTVHVMDNVAGVGGIVVQGRRGPAGSTCAKVQTNTVDYPNGNPGVNGIRVRQVSPATVSLETGSGSGTAASVLATNNPSSTTEVLGTVGVVANGTCPAPL